MNTELILEARKKKRTLIIAQAIGVVFGIVFAIDNADEGIGDFIQAIIALPFILALALRLAFVAFQFFRIKLGRKLYDDNGVCIAVVPRTALGVVAGFLTVYLTLVVIIGVGSVSDILLIIIIVAAIALEVFFAMRDIKYLRKTKSDTNGM